MKKRRWAVQFPVREGDTYDFMAHATLEVRCYTLMEALESTRVQAQELIRRLENYLETPGLYLKLCAEGADVFRSWEDTDG